MGRIMQVGPHVASPLLRGRYVVDVEDRGNHLNGDVVTWGTPCWLDFSKHDLIPLEPNETASVEYVLRHLYEQPHADLKAAGQRFYARVALGDTVILNATRSWLGEARHIWSYASAADCVADLKAGSHSGGDWDATERMVCTAFADAEAASAALQLAETAIFGSK